MTLPTAAKDRKATPIATGVIDYFPDAIAAVAHVSFVGNEQHNPGTALHWDRAKSTDEADALLRHFLERGTLDSDGIRHSAKVAWRALALLQKEIERARVEAIPAPVVIVDARLRAAAEACYGIDGGPSPHLAWPGKTGKCAGCGITRAQAAVLGHDFA